MEFYHSAIYQNLRLLVQIFPNLDIGSKLQEGMFKKPNTKGMQSVFYSLITILNPEYCHQHLPWPISFQSDNYKFRTSVINFIKMECADFEPPQLLSSLLNKAEGEKYVKLLFEFVSYVTKTILKRKKVSVLHMPSAEIDEDESNHLLEVVSDSIHKRIYSERQLCNEMVKNSSRFLNHSNSELKKVSKTIRQKKENLHDELKHLLSYTNINERIMVECALSDYKDEVYELRRNYSLIRQDTSRILTKKERLLRLVDLLHSSRFDVVSSGYLTSVITKNLASQINVPLSTIVSAVFVDSKNGPLISLIGFLHYAYLLLRSRQQRFLRSEVPDQDHVVNQKAKEIFDNVTKKVNELKCLDQALDSIIRENEEKIPDLRSRCRKHTIMNNEFVETMRELISMKNNYRPRTLVQFPERSLLLEMPEAAESNEDIVENMVKRMSFLEDLKN